MKQPSLPENENQRVHALRRYGVLDSATELVFDEFVELVARTFEVPIALISLVDTDRQWFKSRFGIGATETPREVSFCAHVVADGVPLIVEDTLEDVRFSDNPLVTDGPKIRFYAGAPLLTPEGYVLGTFCVVDQRPRTLRAEQLETLQLFSRQVMRILELRRQQLVAQTYRNLFMASHTLAAIVGVDGEVFETNPVWAQHLGLQAEDIGRLGWPGLVVAEDLAVVNAALLRVQSGEALVFEVRMLKRDGGACWVSWHANHDRAENITYMVGHDITELKKVDRLKSEFVSSVSHELRTPLTAIRGALGLLDGGALGELAAGQHEMVQVALASTKRLARLVDDILDIGKVERGVLDFEFSRVDLCEVAARAIAQVMDTHSSSKIRVVLDAPEPCWCVTDGERVLQVLSNLLSNAHRFSPEAGTVEVRVRSSGDFIVTSVADHGLGIPLDFQARVFQRFAQADASDERHLNGTGLGLSIAKAIVEQLGGKIEFSSSKEGTTFQFELPRGAAEA